LIHGILIVAGLYGLRELQKEKKNKKNFAKIALSNKIVLHKISWKVSILIEDTRTKQPCFIESYGKCSFMPNKNPFDIYVFFAEKKTSTVVGNLQ